MSDAGGGPSGYVGAVRVAVKVKVRGVVAGATASGLAVASRLLFDWPSLSWVPGTVAVGSSMLLASQACARVRLGQPRLCLTISAGEKVRRLARTEGIVAVGLASAGIISFLGERGTASRDLACWIAAGTLFLLAGAYVVVEAFIGEVIETHGVPRLPQLLGDIQLGPLTLRALATRWSESPFHFVVKAGRWLLESRPHRVSRYSALLLAVTLVSATTTAAVPFTETAPAATRESQSSSSEDRANERTADDGGGGGGGAGGGGEQGTFEPTFEDVCGPTPVSRPGQDAGWASSGLWGLYFDPGAGFGAVEAGCPEPVEEVRDAGDEVVFQRGMKEKGLRSVALVSRRHGPAMFLDDAAVVILGFLTDGIAASGSSRIDIGNGDVQLVLTGKGTVTLVRGRKVRPGTDRSEPLVQLPPAATTAWHTEMERLGTWLWPGKLEPTDAGLRRFGLAYEVDGSPLVILTVDEAGGTATISRSGTTSQVRAETSHVDAADITALAPAVPRS